jgi:hypothetical protein
MATGKGMRTVGSAVATPTRTVPTSTPIIVIRVVVYAVARNPGTYGVIFFLES